MTTFLERLDRAATSQTYTDRHPATYVLVVVGMAATYAGSLALNWLRESAQRAYARLARDDRYSTAPASPQVSGEDEAVLRTLKISCRGAPESVDGTAKAEQQPNRDLEDRM